MGAMSPDASRPAGLLLVHAHPGDECFATGGLIARSIAEASRRLVVCTGGERARSTILLDHQARPRMRSAPPS
jgi:LmbE family N-acetylglucosaminyl deacetylase